MLCGVKLKVREIDHNFVEEAYKSINQLAEKHEHQQRGAYSFNTERHYQYSKPNCICGYVQLGSSYNRNTRTIIGG